MPMQATPASEWRSKLVELPSGNVAALRRPDLLRLISIGDDVPDFLTGQVMKGLNGKSQTSAVTADTIPDVVKALDWVARACFVTPKLVAVAVEENELSLDDVSFSDKMFVFQWAMGDAGAAATRFLAQPNGGMAAVSAVPDVSDLAE